MSRKTIAIIGYLIIGLFGAVLTVGGVLTIRKQTTPGFIMIPIGIIFLMIAVRGSKQFLQQEKRSEHDQNV